MSVQSNPRTLAIGALYVLTGKAVPGFPGSTRANPSYRVRVYLSAGAPLRTGDQGNFPMIVRWDVWDEVMVPVLEENAPLQHRAVQTHETLLAQLEKAISDRMKERGFLPPDPPLPEPITQPTHGELVIRGDPIVDPLYQVVDVESLEHLEGHPKLVYPEVDGGPK